MIRNRLRRRTPVEMSRLRRERTAVGPGRVGRGREQAVRPMFATLQIRVVKFCRRNSESARIATDFVQRGEPEVTVKAGVLNTLRHQRAGELLKLHGEPEHRPAIRFAAGFGLASEQNLAHEVIRRGIGRRALALCAIHRFFDVAPISL